MTTHALTSWAFWRCYWITARPYLFFVSGAAGLVGLAMAEGIGPLAFTAAFAALFVSYGLGQALTDVSQLDTDALSSPYRPLVQGVVSPAQVRAVSLVGFGCCGVLLLVLNPWTLALAALGVVGLATYTWFKRRWWAGPLYNAWIVALLPAIGFLCGGASPAEALASVPLLAAMVSVFCSYAVFVILGYLKDISADRATGYVTFPVRFGWRPAVAVSAVFTVAALGASLVVMAGSAAATMPAGPHHFVAWALWLAGLLSLVLAHITLWRTGRESDAHGGIAWSVRGFVLLHLGHAAALRPELAALALGIYGLFEIVLIRRPERSQV